MFERADSSTIPASPTPSPVAFPAWARARNPPETEAEAAFLAGAALARLDAILRENPPWAGLLRRRLALLAAAASVADSGRGEDEAALRDAFHLTRTGADPGPAGRRLVAWRALTAGSTGAWRRSFENVVETLGVCNGEAVNAALEAAAACAAGHRLAPFAAARAHRLVRRALAPAVGGGGGAGEGELLAAWLADCVLAQKLKWPFAPPMLAEGLSSTDGRRPARDLDEASETTRVLFGYARAAERACDLAGDLARKARKLVEAAPKLRAKGAGAALRALLDDDSLSAATRLPGLSERGARRLFDRLVALGAIRELTGRPTFRLYGL